MTEEVFYAIVKLVTGEELLAKVCAFEENDEVLIVLDNPIIVKFITIPNQTVPLIKVEPWINLSKSTTFILKRDHIVLITEVKDESITKIHQRYSFEEDSKNISNHSQITSGMGYVNTVENARKELEKLYQSKETYTNLD
jgi:hypothetical protein